MKEKNKSLIILIIVVAALVVAYVLWLSYANKKVREVVDNSIERIEQRLEASGNEVTVTYDDVKVHGMSLRPRASVYKLHVKIDDKRRAREMHVMLPEVVYVPKTFDMHSYRLEVLDSVSVVSNRRNDDEQSVIIDFSRSPALDVDQRRDGSIAYSLYVPQNISLSNAAQAEAEVATAEKTDITFESEPQVEWSENAQGVGLDQKAIFPHTLITQGGQQKAELDNFSAETKHSTLEDGQYSYDTLVKMENLNFSDKELKVLNPVSVVNEVTYTGPAVATGAEAISQPMHINIKNVAWMTGLMSVFASGEVHFVPAEEKMPYGQLSLRVNNLDRFLDYVSEQRPNATEYMAKVREALEKLSGAVIEENGEVTIKLAREPKGRLHVGALTLEDALGLLIEMAMKMPDMSASKAPAITEEEVMEEEATEGMEEEMPANAENETTEEEETSAEETISPATEQKTDDAAPVTDTAAQKNPEIKGDAEVEVENETSDLEIITIKPEADVAPQQVPAENPNQIAPAPAE